MAVMSFKSMEGYVVEVHMDDEKAKSGSFPPTQALPGAMIKLINPNGVAIVESMPGSANQKGVKPTLKHRLFMMYADVFFGDPWKHRIYVPEWLVINQDHPLVVLEKIAGQMFATSFMHEMMEENKSGNFIHWKTATRDVLGLPRVMKIEHIFSPTGVSLRSTLSMELRFSKGHNRDAGKAAVSGNTTLELHKYHLGDRYIRGETDQRPIVPWFDHMIADNREVIERFYDGFVDVDATRNAKK